MTKVTQSAIILILTALASLSARTPAFKADGPLPVSATSYPIWRRRPRGPRRT